MGTPNKLSQQVDETGPQVQSIVQVDPINPQYQVSVNSDGSLNIRVANGNSNGQATMVNSSPVVIASNQPSELAVGVDDGATSADTHGFMVGGVTGGGHFERLQMDSASGGALILENPQAHQVAVSTTLAAAAAGSITLPGLGGCFTWLRGLCITSVSATAEVHGVVTITGLTNTMSFEYTIPTTGGGKLVVDFGKDGIQSSAFNTPIVVNFPVITGGSATALAAWGYQY